MEQPRGSLSINDSQKRGSKPGRHFIAPPLINKMSYLVIFVQVHYHNGFDRLYQIISNIYMSLNFDGTNLLSIPKAQRVFLNLEIDDAIGYGGG